MRVLVPKFGVSDVGLRKACVRAAIPLPNVGYWAKAQAGKKVQKVDLPSRLPGMSDEVTIGGSRCNYYNSEPEIPSEPTFIETIEQVREAISRKIPRRSVLRSLETHPAIRALLQQDEERRKKQLESPYLARFYELKFDTPREKRRLRVANAILTVLARLGYSASSDKDGTAFYARVGEQRVSFSLEYQELRASRKARRETKHTKDLLRAIICSGQGVWQDTEDRLLEASIWEIAVEVVVAGEEQYRASSVRHYEWSKERKAAIERERIKAAEEARRREHERQEKLKQQRIERLLAQAGHARQAQEIRVYVELVLAKLTGNSIIEQGELLDWKAWALAQADSIDPTINGAWRDAVGETI